MTERMKKAKKAYRKWKRRKTEREFYMKEKRRDVRRANRKRVAAAYADRMRE